MNNFFTQFSEYIKENNNNKNLNINNNYNNLNDDNNKNNYPFINENNNNFNNDINNNIINNQNHINYDDDNSDNHDDYKLKIDWEKLEYSHFQYDNDQLQFEMKIINEVDCFQKHFTITCEPNGVLYFDNKIQSFCKRNNLLYKLKYI